MTAVAKKRSPDFPSPRFNTPADNVDQEPNQRNVGDLVGRRLRIGPQTNLRPTAVPFGRNALRGGRDRNRALTEQKTLYVNTLRRFPSIEMFKWNFISDKIRAESESSRPEWDHMRLTLRYQSLLDSGAVKTRAELTRCPGVCRARVTQVFKCLKTFPDRPSLARAPEEIRISHACPVEFWILRVTSWLAVVFSTD